MARAASWRHLLPWLPAGLLLAGCPIYDERPLTCLDGDCACDPMYCRPGGPYCYAPSGCGTNETCGSDFLCHPGDCSVWGCPGSEYACVQSDSGQVSLVNSLL
jgi:hypothetical protein